VVSGCRLSSIIKIKKDTDFMKISFMKIYTCMKLHFLSFEYCFVVIFKYISFKNVFKPMASQI